ncbi:hypothetical protein [Mycobacteroides chelonae]|uniref:hypothetical protein n=1 Tax=Mycobacteroides chelonae TaxID=1774 RepID=UPI0009937137|nr:hypothetical protein [Mycobacteroides chelonae]
MNGEAVRRWIFERHCHPVSAWSRWATTPLLLVPVWTRRWRWAVPIAAWLAINPVATGTALSMAITLLAWRRYAHIWEANQSGR